MGGSRGMSFVMIDNPAANEVKLERLVGVPDGNAIYRARWKIWSGWHLLWGVQNIAGKDRLILRTSAMCEHDSHVSKFGSHSFASWLFV